MRGKFKRDYWIIRLSRLFDKAYYLKQYPDVRKADVDPIEHYVLYGWKEGRNPALWFDTNEYLEKNPDVAQAGVNPFAHWIKNNKHKVNKSKIQSLKYILGHIRDNPFLIKKFFKEVNRAGFRYALFKTKEYIKKFTPTNENFDLNLIENDEITVIEFKDIPNPIVSIIIPVYNKFRYTYACLKSIYKHTDLDKIEVIITDDASTDETRHIDRYVKNVKVIKNAQPLGFLKNCNNASKYAKGNYILFLNNDTQVQADWLDWLLKTFNYDKKIGMVGSKLVYPDGRLQEAGGIIWKDGTGWNYGRLDDPNKPEYNYVKEVDYISGACILIKKELWDEIGGFDERYTPAYFEDTDLAFEIRKRGYKVVYQPKSVVVHFEGISHGRDISEGIKRYQEINREKFVKKWNEILEKEHLPNGEAPFIARDRSIFKKHILVIDHYVPHYDQDAGSKTVFTWLKIFKDLDFQITFIGDNFYPHEPYTTELQQMGIEVIYGPYYARHWKDFLKNNIKYFDYVLLNRAWISEKYIDIIKHLKENINPRLKILYYPHDLSFLRLLGEYQITKNLESLKESNRLKEIEYSIFQKSDCILLPSEEEKKIIELDLPEKEIVVVPPFVYNSSFPLTKNENFEEREGILFVGGFRHRPNYFGVKWFIENIWNSIKQRLGNINFYIVGSAIPEDIQALNERDSNIKVLGYVSEHDLEVLYSKVRVVVAPLLYGAGVKGKVIEAIAYGVPLVTTPIGAEGIDNAEEVILIAEDEMGFAESVCKLYSDKDLWMNLRKKQKAYSERYLSYDYVKTLFAKIFNKNIEGIRA